MSFEDYWPDLEGELRRMLLGRGVPAWLIDDVVQETGVKLWQMWERVDWERSVESLARKMALNLLRDHWRRAARREVPGTVPDRVAITDVEREVLARSELRAVGRAVRTLQSSYRSALLGEIGVGKRGSGGAARMLRLRARRELAALVDRASGFGILVGQRTATALRNLGGRMSARLGPREAEGLAYATAGLFAFVLIAGAPPGKADQHAPAETPSVGHVGSGSGFLLADIAPGGRGVDLRELGSDAVKDVKDLLDNKEGRPLARSKLGRFGEIEAEGEVVALGLRAGTGDDGSLVVGCANGTETGPTGVGGCELGQTQTRANADIHYRLGERKGRLRISTDRK